MSSSSLPIGVFDSGLGGLSVLRELQRALPNEDFLYLGDVARLPYGTKSSSVVGRYASLCAGFLLERKIKALVIACNTATAMALESLKAELPIPVFGVIGPGVRAGLSATKGEGILVLATESTVRSEAYPREFLRQAADAPHIEQIACPLLVPLAEEGWFDNDVTVSVIQTYLSRATRPYDTVVMGCTHYPLLESSFRKVVREQTALVHGGGALAAELSAELDRRALRRPEGPRGRLSFFATDHVSAHLPLSDALFEGPVRFDIVEI